MGAPGRHPSLLQVCRLPATAMPSIIVVDQTTEVADPLTVTVAEVATMAKAEEEALVIEEPGVIKDI